MVCVIYFGNNGALYVMMKYHVSSSEDKKCTEFCFANELVHVYHVYVVRHVKVVSCTTVKSILGESHTIREEEIKLKRKLDISNNCKEVNCLEEDNIQGKSEFWTRYVFCYLRLQEAIGCIYFVFGKKK